MKTTKLLFLFVFLTLFAQPQDCVAGALSFSAKQYVLLNSTNTITADNVSCFVRLHLSGTWPDGEYQAKYAKWSSHLPCNFGGFQIGHLSFTVSQGKLVPPVSPIQFAPGIAPVEALPVSNRVEFYGVDNGSDTVGRANGSLSVNWSAEFHANDGLFDARVQTMSGVMDVDLAWGPCDSCVNCAAGNIQPGDKGQVSISLGKGQYSDSTTSLTFSPSSLGTNVPTTGDFSVQLGQSADAVASGGALSQVLSENFLAQFNNVADGVEVALYPRPANVAKDSETGLYQPDANAMKTITFKRATAEGDAAESVSVTENTGGAIKTDATISYSAATENWSVNVAGSGIGNEHLTPAGGVEQRIERKLNSDGTVAEQTTTDIIRIDGVEKAQVIRRSGDGGPDETLTFTYYGAEDAARAGLEKTRLSSSGEWSATEYDTSRRVTKVTKGWLDSAFGSADAQNKITTVSYDDTTNTKTVVVTVAGVERARAFEHREAVNGDTSLFVQQTATKSGVEWGDAGNLVTTTLEFSSAPSTQALSPFAGKPIRVVRSNGTATTYVYSRDNDAGTQTTIARTGAWNAGSASVISGTETTTVINSSGSVISKVLKDITSDRVISSQTTTAWNTFGQPRTVEYEDGRTEISEISDCCGPDVFTDRTGAKTTYLRDGLHRETSRTSDDVTTLTTYNGAGHVTELRRQGANATDSLRTAAFDQAGRPLNTTELPSEPGGQRKTTTFLESLDGGGHRTVTFTLPGGGTRVETFYLDGRLMIVTGTATQPVRYEYGAEAVNRAADSANCTFTKEIRLDANGADTAEWSKSYTDMAGRVFRSVRPLTAAGDSLAITDYSYNSLGQLVKTADPDGVTALYSYNARGEREVSAVDLDRNGSIDNAGTDRIVKTVSDVTSHNNLTVLRTTVQQWQANGQNAPTTVSITEATASGLDAWVTQYGRVSESHTQSLGNGLTRRTTTVPGGASVVEDYDHGRLTSFVSKDDTGAAVSSKTYDYTDPFKRLHTLTDSLIGDTVYTYKPDDHVATVTQPDPDGAGPLGQPVTQYFYDVSGQLVHQVLPDGGEVFTEYYLTGSLKNTHGARTTPVAYTYDAQGRAKTLTTWTDFAGSNGAAVTTWNYEPATGRLANKRFSDGNGPDFSYTPAGRLQTRDWARSIGGARIRTTYTYDNGGLSTGETYNDGTTPAVVITPDRRGLASTLTDGIGTRTRTWNADGTLDLESYTTGMFAGLALDPKRDVHPLGLRTGLDITGPTAGKWMSLTYGYDHANRLSTVTQAADGQSTLSAGYGYLPNSNLVSGATLKRNDATVLSVGRNYDGLGRINGWSQTVNATTLASTSYAYNAAGQRVSAVAEDSSWWEYGYDGIGQLTGGVRKWSDGTVVAGQSFGFTFDDLGNRKTVARETRTATWGANGLNEVGPRDGLGKVDVMGEVNADANVVVNAKAVTRQGTYFYSEAGPTARGDDGNWFNVRIAAAKPGAGANGTDALALEQRNVWLPPASESFTHDADGNLTGDSQFKYTWDAENRLVQVQRKPTAVAAGASELRVTFSYDAEGRRVRVLRETRSSTGDAWQTTDDRRLVWDGWCVVGELDASGNVLATYTWGLDLSGTEQGAGGIGGLLWQRRGGKDLLTLSDGQGNVTGLYDAAAAQVAAKYSYGPFGEVLRSSGVEASGNPFRWAGKYGDSELGLVNYGYRDYRPELGRWLTRDPLGESGGVNLYAYCGNSPMNGIDYLGMDFLGVDWGYFWSGVASDTGAAAHRFGQGLLVLNDSGDYLVAAALGKGDTFNGMSELYQSMAAHPERYNANQVQEQMALSAGRSVLAVGTLGSSEAFIYGYQMGSGDYQGAQDTAFGASVALSMAKTFAGGSVATADAANSASPASAAGAAEEAAVAELRANVMRNIDQCRKGNASSSFDKFTEGEPISPKTSQKIPSSVESPLSGQVSSDADLAISQIKNGTNPGWGGKWGDTHGNFETNLPTTDASGGPITYSEYYLPKSAGATSKWGANRLVVGSDGNIYITTTHYGQSGSPPFVWYGKK